MNQRKAIWIIVLALILMSTTSAAVVLAGDDRGKASGGDRFSTRVAEILELDEAVVADALRQAREELRQARGELRAEKRAATEAKLSALVASGGLSQEEADAKLQRFRDREKKTGFRTGSGLRRNR